MLQGVGTEELKTANAEVGERCALALQSGNFEQFSLISMRYYIYNTVIILLIHLIEFEY